MVVTVVYLIAVYDVEAGRTELFKRFLRQYLVHLQDSVFEGKVTAGQAEDIKSRLNDMQKEGESVVVHVFETSKYTERVAFGDDPAEDDALLF